MIRYILIFLSVCCVVSCSSTESTQSYDKVIINEDDYTLSKFRTEDPSDTDSDLIITVQSITDFTLTGSDLGEPQFPDLTIELTY